MPPNQLIVYDISGREVTSVVGPLTEGSDLVLTCEVRGGKWTSLFNYKLLRFYYSLTRWGLASFYFMRL